MSNEERIAQLLDALVSESPVKLDTSFLSSLSNDTLRFVRFEKGEYLTHMPISEVIYLRHRRFMVYMRH